MDAGTALAELQEIAPTIRAAVILSDTAEPEASTLAEPSGFATAVRELLRAAEELRPTQRRGVERLLVTTREGGIVAVAAGGRTIAAATTANAPAALVAHDLHTCLTSLDQERARVAT